MKTKIYLLSAKNCPRCKAMKALAETVVQKVGVDRAECVVLDALSDEGVALAVQYGADEVPAIIVNGKVFQISRRNCNIASIKSVIVEQQ